MGTAKSILCQSGLRQSAQMSKITNDVLTRSGTGCCTHMATMDVKVLNGKETQTLVKHVTLDEILMVRLMNGQQRRHLVMITWVYVLIDTVTCQLHLYCIQTA